MAKIYIRGHVTPQTVTVQVAKQVDAIKADKNIENNYYIQLEGFSCDKGDIKSVVVYDTEDDKAQGNSEKQNDNGERLMKYNNDFINEIKSYANGNLEKKLQFNLKVAKMYCFALTGKEIDEYKPELKTLFVEELKTEKLVVNPTKYLKLFKVQEMTRSNDLTKVDYLIRKAPLRIMQSYLMNVYDVIR